MLDFSDPAFEKLSKLRADEENRVMKLNLENLEVQKDLETLHNDVRGRACHLSA